jgi:thiol-disulfide isomerase/thioredoxin
VIGAAYAVGSAVVLLALTLVGRRLLAPLRRGHRMQTLQRALGAVMVVTAVAMAFQLDVRFQESIAEAFPSLNLADGLERSDAVQSRLDDLRGKAKFAAAKGKPSGASPGKASDLLVLGNAPEFTETQRWFNTPGDRPLTMQGLRGKVVLIDFWTYTCINCIRTLPYLKAWDEKYRDDGLVIVGVHTPEFSFEKDAGNVEKAIASDGIEYPVVQDNEYGTWEAYGNNVWPAEYLVDAQGRVRDVKLGEGDYDAKERDIRSLLIENGADLGGGMSKPRGVITPGTETTPETYVGADRAEGFTEAPQRGTKAYTATPGDALDVNQFSLGGIWDVGGQAARAGIGASLSAKVHAENVYLVLSPPPGEASGAVQVAVDGGLPRTITVRRQRLYTLAEFGEAGTHVLTLRPQSGVAAYAFTFG